MLAFFCHGGHTLLHVLPLLFQVLPACLVVVGGACLFFGEGVGLPELDGQASPSRSL